MMENEKLKVCVFNYRVFDEAQYFLQDALFNQDINYLLDAIKIKLRNSIKIFISATFDETAKYFDFIESGIKIGLEQSVFYDNQLGIYKELLYPKRIPVKQWNYSINFDYSHIKVKYFSDFQEIIDLVNRDTTGEKWLIFVSRKQEGEFLKNNIKDSIFVYSEEQRSKETAEQLNLITKNNCFPSKCLISTKLLDNGVNLVDSQLTHIVISTIDKTEFLQMLGRKRLIPGSSEFNLYIQTKSKKAFSGYLHLNINRIVKSYYTFKENYCSFLEEYYSTPQKMELICKYYYFSQGKLEPNKAAFAKLYNLKSFCEKIIEQFDKIGESAFIIEQLSWLGLESTFDKTNYVNAEKTKENRNELNEFLASITGKTLDANQQIYFRKNFLDLVTVLYGKFCRMDRLPGLNVINKKLEEIGSSYIVSSQKLNKSTNWLIEKRY